jgi:hypothetical protein
MSRPGIEPGPLEASNLEKSHSNIFVICCSEPLQCVTGSLYYNWKCALTKLPITPVLRSTSVSRIQGKVLFLLTVCSLCATRSNSTPSDLLSRLTISLLQNVVFLFNIADPDFVRSKLSCHRIRNRYECFLDNIIKMSSQLSAQWVDPPWGAEPRFELGPALKQASGSQHEIATKNSIIM